MIILVALISQFLVVFGHRLGLGRERIFPCIVAPLLPVQAQGRLVAA